MIFNECDGNVWRDSSLDRIVIEYNDIMIDIDTETGMRKIILKNHIAFDYIGQWDENIIKAIYVEKDNDFISHALERVNTYNDVKYKGGGTRDIKSDWKCVVIQLIDNICIRIVCSDIVYCE